MTSLIIRLILVSQVSSRTRRRPAPPQNITLLRNPHRAAAVGSGFIITGEVSQILVDLLHQHFSFSTHLVSPGLSRSDPLSPVGEQLLNQGIPQFARGGNVGDLYRGSLVSSQFNQHRSRVDPTQTMQSCTSIECIGYTVVDIDTTIKWYARMGADPWHSRGSAPPRCERETHEWGSQSGHHTFRRCFCVLSCSQPYSEHFIPTCRCRMNNGPR